MMHQNSSTNVRRPSRVSGKSKPRAMVTCLLCRVLWPVVVQHRHLMFDGPFEANTWLKRCDPVEQ